MARDRRAPPFLLRSQRLSKTHEVVSQDGAHCTEPQSIAQAPLRHRFLGTEHLLLALVRDSDSARILVALGVEAQTVASAVEAAVSPGSIEAISELGVTARAKKVFQLAVDEADLTKHNQVGPGQLLVALLREGEGVAAKVLRGLGVDLQRLRLEVARVAGATPT